MKNRKRILLIILALLVAFMPLRTYGEDDTGSVNFLADVLTVSTSMEQKYGIKILILDECQDVAFDGYTLKPADDLSDGYLESHKVSTDSQNFEKHKVSGNSQDSEDQAIISFLEKLDSILSVYPDGFFRQFSDGEGIQNLRIILTAGIEGEVTAAGLTDIHGQFIDMALDISFPEVLNTTFNHEIFHAVGALALAGKAFIIDLEKWMSFNPPGFEYEMDYSDYNKLREYTFIGDSSGNEIYFYSPYSRTMAREDMAVVFECAMCPEERDAENFFAHRWPQEKLVFICDMIRNIFDTADWPEVLPWETFIKIYDKQSLDLRYQAG